MSFLSDLFVEALFGEAFGRAKKFLSRNQRLRGIEAAIQAWVNSLPSEFQVVPGALFPHRPPDDLSEVLSIQVVGAELAAERLPTPAQWSDCFLALWRAAVARLEAAGDPGQPLFQHREDDVRPLFLKLGARVDASLRADPTLAASTVLEIIRGSTQDATSVWDEYSRRLRDSVAKLSLVGLPGLTVSFEDAIPLTVTRGGRSFEGRFIHAEQHDRVLITGAAGGGKSGLLRLIAAEALQQGHRVARGRLKTIATWLGRGETFSDALNASITDGLCAPDQGSTIAGSAEILLLDGLDETDTLQPMIAERLSQTEHRAKIVVTSRDPAHAEVLGEFTHYALAGTDKLDLSAFVRRIAEQHGNVDDTTLRRVNELLEAHPELGTPLLVGFVLGIAFRAGSVQLPTSPAHLYERILHLVARTGRNDRTFQTRLEPDVALAELSKLAWHRLQDPIAARLLSAAGVSHSIVTFWEERGILDVNRGASEDIVEFTHASVGDFCAARHLLTFDEHALVNEVDAISDDPRWRQVLAFAGALGRLDSILDGVLTREDDFRALLGGEIAAGADTALLSTVLVDKLAARVAPERPPVIAVEAAALIARLVERRAVPASYVDQLFGTHADRSTVWDRLGVLRVRLALAAAGVNSRLARQWMLAEADEHGDDALSFGRAARSWRSTYQGLVRHALEVVLATEGDEASADFFRELRRRKLLSLGALSAAREIGLRRGATSLVDATHVVYAEELKAASKGTRVRSFLEDERERHGGFCDLFDEAFPERSDKSDSGLALAILLHSCGYMECAVDDASIFRDAKIRARFVPIMRMWAAGLSLDPAMVGGAARLAIRKLSEDPTYIAYVDLPTPPARRLAYEPGLYKGAPDVASIADLLNRGSVIELLQRMLTPLLLSHPQDDVARVIDELIAADELMPSTWHWLGHYGRAVWGAATDQRASQILREDARAMTLSLVDCVDVGVLCEPLIRSRLREAVMSDEFAQKRAGRVMAARFAAVGLARIGDGQARQDAWDALLDWSNRPVTDNPRYVPDSPIDILAEFLASSEPDLTRVRGLALHPDESVRVVATTRLRAAFVKDIWDGFIGTAGEATAIKALAANTTPEELAWLLEKANSERPSVRGLVAATLESVDAPSVDGTLAKLSSDQDPEVRDTAVRSMRRRKARPERNRRD